MDLDNTDPRFMRTDCFGRPEVLGFIQRCSRITRTSG